MAKVSPAWTMVTNESGLWAHGECWRKGDSLRGQISHPLRSPTPRLEGSSAVLSEGRNPSFQPCRGCPSSLPAADLLQGGALGTTSDQCPILHC